MNEINDAVRSTHDTEPCKDRSGLPRALWAVDLRQPAAVGQVREHWVRAFSESGHWQIHWVSGDLFATQPPPDVLIVLVEASVNERMDTIVDLISQFGVARPVVVALCADPDPALSLVLFRHGTDLVLPSEADAQVIEAQVRVIVRRLFPRPLGDPIERGRLRLDPAIKRVCHLRGESRLDTALTPTECRILEVLLQRPYRAHARAELIHSVWGSQSRVDVRTIDVHMRRLREGLSRIGCDAMLETVRGVGYRLVPD
jgi:two-component system phosphate regulon response regulator PhoB